MEDIKFRQWHDGKFYYWGIGIKGAIFTSPIITGGCFIESQHEQYTGLKDKNGKEIFTGDLLRVRKPARSEQTHYGDNIPNGEYTEPLEPIIEETIDEVVFKDGMFGVVGEQDEVMPLLWVVGASEQFSDINSLKEGFEGHWNYYSRRPDEWEEDIQFICEEYGLKDVNEIIAYLGAEVIGNIYENADLLNA